VSTAKEGSGVVARGAPRPVLREDSALVTRAPRRPAELALSDRSRAELWRAACVFFMLASAMVSYLSIRAARTEERVFVLDPAGNVLAGPSESMAESRGFFSLTALHCTNAVLQRSPEGFDLYELLRLYFTPRAVQKLDEDWLARKEDAQSRNLQQKPLVERIGEPVKAGAERIVEVRGRLVRAGAYAGRSFYDELPFSLVLTYIRNADLGKAGSYPWVCKDFVLSIKEVGE